MRIKDYETSLQVKTVCALKSALLKRYGAGVNEFWMSLDDQEFPVMALLVNGDFACVQYFPRKDHPGHISNAASLRLVDGEDAIFFVNTPMEEIAICVDQVVSFDDALHAAEEFFDTGVLPKSIMWEEL